MALLGVQPLQSFTSAGDSLAFTSDSLLALPSALAPKHGDKRRTFRALIVRQYCLFSIREESTLLRFLPSSTPSRFEKTDNWLIG